MELEEEDSNNSSSLWMPDKAKLNIMGCHWGVKYTWGVERREHMNQESHSEEETGSL